MKLFLTLAFSVFSIGASAKTIATPCEFSDYQLLSSAVRNGSTVLTGANLKPALAGLLAEEMGLECNVLTDSAGSSGIPGNKYFTFQISGSGGRNFLVNLIVGGVEQPGTFLSITKK